MICEMCKKAMGRDDMGSLCPQDFFFHCLGCKNKKIEKMKVPKFYCENFIECQHNLPEYTPKDCEKQCEKCVNVILDHHSKKYK